jgi:purine-binding chemotaxis protein CheW
VSLQEVKEPTQAVAVEGLVFELSSERFGIPLADVAEVVRAVAIRKLPSSPAITLGIIDVRGELVPVLDVRVRFGFAHKPLELTDQFVIGKAGLRKVALHVDRVVSLMQLSMVPIERAKNLRQGIERLAGIASTEEGLVLIHDLKEFLTQAEAETLDGALATARSNAEPPWQ